MQSVQFYTAELMPLADGTIGVLLKSTIFDEQELELLDRELDNERVPTLDQALAVIRQGMTVA